jgi:hypothetical protein
MTINFGAFRPSARATHFQNTFGPSVDGDVQFVVNAYASVFGHPGSGSQIQQFADQLNYFEALYTAAGTFWSPSNIDLLARGAVYGQMLGIEHESAPVGIEPGGTIKTLTPTLRTTLRVTVTPTLRSALRVTATPTLRSALRVTVTPTLRSALRVTDTPAVRSVL